MQDQIMTALTDQTGGGKNTEEPTPTCGTTAPKLAEIRKANYRLRLAENVADVRSAQLLRFVVFNLELQEGLEQSYATCLDADRFDAVCDHLLVEDLKTGEVVGTYRLQTGLRAGANVGYYSAQEFDFRPFEPLRREMVELGRACVHSNHRNLMVLSLLWRGIANYATANGCRYLIGCSSLTSQDPVDGMAAYNQMQAYLVPGELRTRALSGYECPEVDPGDHKVRIPKLLGAYLALGAKICGTPALDREFKTIDFLTFLDLYSMPEKMMTRYMS